MMLTEDAYHLIHPTIKVDKMMKNPIKFSMKNYVQLPASVKNKCLKTIPKHSNCVSHIHCELRLLPVGKGLTVLP